MGEVRESNLLLVQKEMEGRKTFRPSKMFFFPLEFWPQTCWKNSGTLEQLLFGGGHRKSRVWARQILSFNFFSTTFNHMINGRLHRHQWSSLQWWYQNLNMAVMLWAALADPERLGCGVLASRNNYYKNKSSNFLISDNLMHIHQIMSVRILYSVFEIEIV